MNLQRLRFLRFTLILAAAFLFCFNANAQEKAVLLTGAELARIVPSGFYFEGQSAPTQTRNAAAVKFAGNRNIIAALVDTSGYSTDIRAKYEGFLITDSIIRIGGQELAVGAYGFGFDNKGKFNVFDIGGNPTLSVASKNDKDLRRPRPLLMSKTGSEIRLYNGRDYVVVAFK